MAFAIIPFIITLVVNYSLARLNARNGPRLDNLSAAGGDYGIPMARGYGTAVRVTGSFIAQDVIKETKHKVKKNFIDKAFSILSPFTNLLPDQYYYTYSDTFALLLLDRTGDDPVEGISKLWAGGKVIFNGSETVVSSTFGSDGKLVKRKYGKNKYLKSLTVHTGHTEQTVDPILAALLNENSAYVLSHYIVIEDLQLAFSGNSVPAVEALSLVKANQSVAEILENICGLANIDELRDVSTTALASDTSRGYLIDSESTCWDGIKPLMPVFKADAAEVSGQIRFYKRSQYMRATIRLDEMGAYQYGDEPPPKYTFRRETDLDLPQETSLTFIDPDREYQPNTMTSRRSEGSAASNVAANLKIVLAASEGASAAALMHWDAWLGRTALRFSLMDNWNSLAIGHAYGLPVDTEVLPYRIQRRTRGANGIIEVEAISDESVTYTAVAFGSSGTVPDEVSTEIADTRVILMDMPILDDAHDDYGFYVVVAGSTNDWPRGLIEMSSDGGLSFDDLLDQPFEAEMGDVVGTLAAGSTTGLDDTLDTTTVLTVTLLHTGMQLESATDSELDSWANFCFIGKNGLGEYLQFKTATFVSGTTWQLTNLRRGRKGTDHAIATHASGEEFCKLGGPGVYRLVYSNEYDWGQALTFRGVTLHQDEADASTQSFTNSGEGKRPYSPVNVEGTWDGSFNLTATFDWRSRMNSGELGIDDRFEFEVVITSATPDRTIVVTGETFSYTAAQQTADGLTPGDTIVGQIRQTSDVNDGRWRNFTLVGPNSGLFLENDTTPIELEDGSDFELG